MQQPISAHRISTQDGPTATHGKVLGLFHSDWSGPGFFGDVIREHGLELAAVDITSQEVPAPLDDYLAVIVFGGAQQVDQDALHPWLQTEKALIRQAVDTDMPFLGVCLGAQLLADVTGGWVGPAGVIRRGWGDIATSADAPNDEIFGALPLSFRTMIWHSYELRLPPEAIELGRSTTALQAFRVRNRPAWGVQFHPEVCPDELAKWIDRVREADPEAPAKKLQRYLDEAALYSDEQHDLARQICGGFLRHAMSLRSN